MMKKQKIRLSEDLSYIDNTDDLDSKIRATRMALRRDGKALAADFKQIPVEGIKSTFGNAVPFFAKTSTAEKTWNIIQSLVSLLVNNPAKKNFKGAFDKQYIQYTAKQIGIYLGLNLIKSWIAKRQNRA